MCVCVRQSVYDRILFNSQPVQSADMWRVLVVILLLAILAGINYLVIESL